MNDKTKEIINFAEKNTDYFQINILENLNDSVTIRNNKISNYSSELKKSILVKVWIKNKEGFSYANKIDLNVLKRAIKIAKLNSKKDYFYGLASKEKYIKNNNFDPKLKDVSPNDLIDECNKAINIISKDNSSKKITVLEGGIHKDITKNKVINSNGIDLEYNTSDYAAYLGTSIGKDSTYDDSKHMCEFFKIDNLAESIRDKTHFYSNIKKLNQKQKQENTTIIFTPDTFSQLLHNAFLDGISAENIINNNSIFTNKLNEKVVGKVSINDNALLNKGVNSRPCDYEGSPSKNTEIIKRGILKNFITDYNSAKKLNLSNTANAYKKNIDFSNIVVDGPYKKIDSAIVVDSIIGAHTSNSLTTDFSVNVDRAHILSSKKPVKNFMLSGKMIDLLKNIISIDKTKIQKGGIYTGSVACRGISIN